ncbi:MAG: YhjD/YihY/BrkB family envelope integrity protein [Deltaproteobacteria bacterium]|nr:YhjD/YihY/BrkB family envelope integrity protein [Deltaproteobacteria bacterium]
MSADAGRTSAGGLRGRLRRACLRLWQVSGRDLWRRELAELGPMRRGFVTALRMAAVVTRGIADHQLTTRAGALTYVTLFSLVPTLAVAFAMFSAFGGLAEARGPLLEGLMSYLAVGVREEVTRGIDGMLANLNHSAIGATGLLFVIVAMFTLLSSVEDVFNDIWGFKRARSYLERLTLYWTVVTISPTLIVLGMSLPGLLRRLAPLRVLLERTGTFDVFFGVALPWLFVVAAFAFLYALLVARRIARAAALVGGLVGGTLWLGGAHLYGWYATSTVYYANVYGSLAAIPIFLFWLYLSWLLVFIGAQAAFAWQHLDRYRDEILATAPSQTSREQVALRILAETVRRFLAGAPPPRVAELVVHLCMSARAVNEATAHLVGLGLLTEVGDDPALLLTCDPRRLTPAGVLQALRNQGRPVTTGRDDRLTAHIRQLYERANAAAEAAWEEVSFADLVQPRAAAAVERGVAARVAGPTR